MTLRPPMPVPSHWKGKDTRKSSLPKPGVVMVKKNRKLLMFKFMRREMRLQEEGR